VRALSLVFFIMKNCILRAPLAVLPLAVLAAFSSHAQTQIMPETVVTATRMAQPVTDVIADVSIISRETLDQAGQTSLREILAQQPGVQITSNGSYRSSTGYLLRGASSSQTIVLIDGIRVGSATAGTASLENIPLARIERIEILRGAASALYGPDAVGGVVQIITREPTAGIKIDLSVGLGSDGQAQAGVSLRGTAGAMGYSVGISRERASGISVIDNPAANSFNPDEDGFSTTSFDARLVGKLNQNNVLTLSVLNSKSTHQFDGTPFPNPLGLTSLTSDAQAKPELTQLSLKWDARWLPNWKSTVLVGYSQDDSISEYFRIGDGVLGGRSHFNTDREQVSWQNDISIGTDLLTLLLESRSEKVDSSTAYTTNKRDIGSVMAGYAVNRKEWNALLVARQDDNSQFGSFTSWALSGGYRLNKNLRTVGSLGTSFQAPTFNQLYFPGFGNAALQPQKNRATEVGLKYDVKGVALSAVLYRNKVQGFIAPATNLQSSRAVLRGLTLSSALNSGSKQYSLSYDYADPRSFTTSPATNNLRLVRVAKHVLNARVTQKLGDVAVFGELKFSSYREDSKVNFAPGRDVLAGYGILNLGANWSVRKDLTLQARVNNVTDKQYTLANTYSMPGRNVFASLVWSR
jgi:vitamin B12 transporter